MSSFTPFDWLGSYDTGDTDLGSGGPVLLDSGSGRFILAGGKPNKSYLVDRACTPASACSGAPDWCHPGGGSCTSDNPKVVLQTVTQPNKNNGMVAGPAYYRGPSGLRVFYGFNFSPMIGYDFQSNRLQSSSPDSSPDSAPATSPIPAVSSHGSSQGSGILWAVFQPLSAGQDLTLHAYDAEDLQDNLFARYGSSIDSGPWVVGSSYGNSFQVPTVIHGKVFTGSSDRLVVFGLKHRPRCTPTIQCDDAVAFHCTKDAESDEFELERKQGEGWESLAEPGTSRVSPGFASLWDYVKDESATYRICTKDRRDECTDEFVIKSSRRSCGPGAKKSDANCGSQGKPPCFLEQAWPIDTRATRQGPRPGGN